MTAPQGLTVGELVEQLASLPLDTRILVVPTNPDEIPETLLVAGVGDVCDIAELHAMSTTLVAGPDDELVEIDDLVVELPTGAHIVLLAARYTESPLQFVLDEADYGDEEP